MIATHAFLKTKLLAVCVKTDSHQIFVENNIPKTFAMTGLIAMPLKSSQDNGSLT